jgi:hypothetical protein
MNDALAVVQNESLTVMGWDVWDGMYVHVPDEPSPTVSHGAVLFPCAEMVPASERLPTRSPYREVELPCKVLLRLPSVAVT